MFEIINVTKIKAFASCDSTLNFSSVALRSRNSFVENFVSSIVFVSLKMLLNFDSLLRKIDSSKLKMKVNNRKKEDISFLSKSLNS